MLRVQRDEFIDAGFEGGLDDESIEDDDMPVPL